MKSQEGRERPSDGEGEERRRRESNPLPRFCRPPPGRQAPAPCVLRPSPEGHVLARNRTWSSTFAKSCARPSHPEDFDRNETAREPPTRESNPAMRLRWPPCVRHTRGETAECPRQESNLVFDLRKVACRPSHAEGAVEADGRSRTGMNLLTRQAPHRSATSAASRGARSRTLSARFGGSLLSQEHAPENRSGTSCVIVASAGVAMRVSGGG